MNGKLFATIRRTAGLTQKQMGDRLRVSRQLIQKIEAEERSIQPYIITRLYIEFGAEFIEEVRGISVKYLAAAE
ncbi:helix-turn-helix domain-containing protein [Virgibacillus dakarensis]|uniref:helix-turn-helix domain-containing protein n=1 Tax=Virgibacillus dakarensis TaxID=1917889 RepID=UPI000B443843|nr:helix-turn-helix transcriptional regulator [Virgibacillus dakarensis]MTW85095.1 helix-turn-helix domain-containing protein [Virgibacillus dakarensis]